MDLDVGEDVEDDNNHSRGISPMPQIRPSERMVNTGHDHVIWDYFKILILSDVPVLIPGFR